MEYAIAFLLGVVFGAVSVVVIALAVAIDDRRDEEMTVIERLKRDPCKECLYYVKETNLCQSKKCSVQGGSYPYVTKFDRMFCEPMKGSENE